MLTAGEGKQRRHGDERDARELGRRQRSCNRERRTEQRHADPAAHRQGSNGAIASIEKAISVIE